MSEEVLDNSNVAARTRRWCFIALAVWLPVGISSIAVLLGSLWFVFSALFGGMNLPNGYKLMTTNASTTAIFTPSLTLDEMQGQLGEYERGPFDHYFAGLNLPRAPRPRDSYPINGIAVAAQVRLIGIERDLIFGFVESSPRSELHDWECPGWFILDTKAEWVECGLDEVAWNARLDELGVHRRRLRRP